MKTIAIYNNKGGVGKSTISANIAHGLSKLGFKTLLIDTDGQENSSRFLGLELEEGDKSFFNLVNEDARLDEVIYNVRENLDVIVSTRAEIKKLEKLIGMERRLDKLFECKTFKDLDKLGYDYILFDCGPNKGALNDSILSYVGNILLPVQLQSASIQGVPAVYSYLEELYVEPTKIKLVIPNMFNKITNDSKENLDVLRKTFSDDILTEPINTRTKISEAGKLGKSVFETDNEEAAQQIFKILKRLVKTIA